MKFVGSGILTRLPLALATVAALGALGCSAVEKGAQVVQDAGKSDTARANVGDCINVIEGSMIDSKTEPVDCSSDKAVYKVVQVFDNKTECHEDYTSYEETLNGGTTAFLCLAPNFKQGLCYNESMLTGYKFVACTASEASFKVVQRIDGQADEQLCGEDADKFLTLAEPKTTFCLGSPKS
ncbi:LppU/SCO3897 family protein [Nocardia sp. bgisy134]|uniref:LppU/SCO3897 family protein n=1 Tax=unclassified Nocardia TaxID=2637762 RepID=UPI003D74DCE5